MPVKIRLQRHGKKGKPFFHIVVADSRAPRDGRFIERIGNYNPITDPATIEINNDRALDWLMKGAQPTDTTRAILSYKGILFQAHLQKGVVKGVMTQEQADAKFEAFTQEQHSKVENKKRRLADSKKQVLSARMEQESKVNTARMDNLRRQELEAKLAAEAPVATEEAAPAAEEGETPAEA